LLSRFNIKSSVQGNIKSGYAGGYGLSIEGVVNNDYADRLIKEE
jgi:hypothetical protein